MGVSYHLYCVLAFSQRSFGASLIKKMGVEGPPVLDSVVFFRTESVVVQTQLVLGSGSSAWASEE